MYGMDCLGDDIVYFENRTVNTCSSQCAEDRACIYWTFATDQSNECLLKSACSNPTSLSIRISGYHTCQVFGNE